MKKHITFKYLKEIEKSEIDIDTLQKIGGKNIFEDGYERVIKNLSKEYGWEGESEPISISDLEKVIAKLKKTGANYVEIYPHGDHNGYVFYGLEIRKSTKEEIDEINKIRKKRDELSRKYHELNTELQKIKAEYDKL
jgi:hypothetical protein